MQKLMLHQILTTICLHPALAFNFAVCMPASIALMLLYDNCLQSLYTGNNEMLHSILLNCMAASNTFGQKGAKCDNTHFTTKTEQMLGSNWIQIFQFGCNPDFMDLTFLLPSP